MKLRVFRTLWGVIPETDGDLAQSPCPDIETALEKIRELGYDGVEFPLKLALLLGKERMKTLLDKHGLKVIIQIFSDGPVVPGAPGVFGGPYKGFTQPSEPGETDKKKLVQTHFQVFKEQVEGAQFFDPVLVNSHSMKDYFTDEMAAEFLTLAENFKKETGFRILHETHRKRYLHSPWVARYIPEKFPTLKMVADLSHWVNVSETGPTDVDLTKVIHDMADRFEHVHCRVGYDHGPQVPDPRFAPWLQYMGGHEAWWDQIWREMDKQGIKEVTMTPEHGPPSYQICDPRNGKPLADIWDVNHWIALRRQERFGEMFGVDNTSKLVASQTQGSEPVTKQIDPVLPSGKNVGFK